MASPGGISATSFTLFPSLPAELRNQIWTEALPDRDSPALFFYKIGCWEPWRIPESHPSYNPAYGPEDDYHLHFEFNPKLLDPVQVDVPLFFVSRESRSIALPWVREQGIETRIREKVDGMEEDEYHPLYFMRPFDPEWDILYIPYNKYDEFIAEPWDRLARMDLIDRSVSTECRACRRIAVPEELLRQDSFFVSLKELAMHFYLRVETMFVAVGEKSSQPDPDSIPWDEAEWYMEGERVPPLRWELEECSEAEGKTISWDDEIQEMNQSKEGKHICDEALYRYIEAEASAIFGEDLTSDSSEAVEFKPVDLVLRIAFST